MVDRRPQSGAEESTAAPGADPPAVSRRRLLLAGASGAAAAAVGVTVVARDRQRHAVDTVRADDRATAADEQASFVGAAMHPFYGAHQPGITTPQPANATFAAFDLRTGVDKDALARLMRILTDDIARIMSGQPALADTAPQLAGTPAGVTVTIGYGPALFDKIGVAGRRPGGFADLPAFGNIDALQPAYTGGDLLLQIAADDAVTTSHTLRMLLKDTRAFATPRWVQRGFRRANGSGPAGSTPRNLMGQIDGTVNPGTPAEFDRLVWHPGPGWFAGGTMMVLRRIKMNLDLWDALAPAEMEEAVGRTLPTGAPLSGGTSEHDPVNFSVADATGLPAIAPFAHIRAGPRRRHRAADPAATVQLRRHPGHSWQQRCGSAVRCFSGQHRGSVPADPAAPRRGGSDEQVDHAGRFGSVRHSTRSRSRRMDRARLTFVKSPTPQTVRYRRRRGAGLVGAISVSALILFAGPVSAHNVLISSDPAADSVLAKPPGEITLVFDQEVETLYAEMAITVGSEQPVAFAPIVDGRSMTADVTVLHLPPSTSAGLIPWKIGYRIVSADGHPVTGLVNFQVGTATARSASTGTVGTVASPASTSRAGAVTWLLIAGGTVVVLAVLVAAVLAIRSRRTPA